MRGPAKRRLLLLLAAGALLGPIRTRAESPPLTLDEALAAAGRASVDLALARTQRDSAAVERSASFSGLLPRLDLTAAAARVFVGRQRLVQVSGLPTSVFDAQSITAPAYDYGNYALALQLQEVLFDGLRTWGRIAQAGAGLRAAGHQLDESALQVSFDLTRRFYELVKAERKLEVLEGTALRSEELVRRADALFAAGRAPRSDTYAARVNLGNDRMAVEAQRAQLTQARVELALAVGRGADEELRVVAPAELDQPGLPAPADPPELPELLEKARQARPLLLAQRERLRAAEEDVTVARSGYFPSLAAGLSYARQGPNFSGQDGVYGDLTRQYVAQAQLTLSWNLFAGRETATAAEQAALGVEKARLGRQGAENQVSSEVARARSTLVSLGRSASLAAENLASAEKEVRLAEERLQAGAGSQLEMRDAVLKLSQARLSLVSARIDLLVAVADLNRAVGGAL